MRSVDISLFLGELDQNQVFSPLFPSFGLGPSPQIHLQSIEFCGALVGTHQHPALKSLHQLPVAVHLEQVSFLVLHNKISNYSTRIS